MVGRTKSLFYSKSVREQKALKSHIVYHRHSCQVCGRGYLWRCVHLIWCSKFSQLLLCAHETYGAKVNDEAVTLIEAVPAERNLRGPDHSPALHMQESLRCQVVGENVV